MAMKLLVMSMVRATAISITTDLYSCLATVTIAMVIVNLFQTVLLCQDLQQVLAIFQPRLQKERNWENYGVIKRSCLVLTLRIQTRVEGQVQCQVSLLVT